MNKLKHYVPDHFLHTHHCTMVLPYLNYGILVWGNTYKTYLNKLVKLQKLGYFNSIKQPILYKPHGATIFKIQNFDSK